MYFYNNFYTIFLKNNHCSHRFRTRMKKHVLFKHCIFNNIFFLFYLFFLKNHILGNDLSNFLSNFLSKKKNMIFKYFILKNENSIFYFSFFKNEILENHVFFCIIFYLNRYLECGFFKKINKIIKILL